MNHRRLARPHLQQYRNRDFVQHLLDERHWEALNSMDSHEACALAMATTGCLDALDEMPAGAMEAWGHLPLYDQQLCFRGLSKADLAERADLAEELIAEILAKERDAWELAFKRQVFARVVQTLNRLGWSVAPWERAAQFKAIALSHRTCTKGGLAGELSVSGRVVEFKMWQTVLPSENPSGPQHDFNKEQRMPYVVRLEMERTRRRIRDYLCNVFTGYTFKQPDPVLGLMGVTAEEMAHHRRVTSGHYKPELGRAEITMASNAIARDGGTIEHGGKVWALDCKGRVVTGTAYYSLNSQWQIVSGRYGLHYAHTGDIFTRPPENLRVKRNQRERRKRLERELQKAVSAMDFKRAEVLKRVLFPSGQLYAIYSKENDCYFDVMYCGYRNSLTDAGKYTRDELRPYLGNELETDKYKAVPVA